MEDWVRINTWYGILEVCVCMCMKFLFLLPCQFVCLTVKELNKHKFYLYISKWDDKVRVSVLKRASLDIFSGAVQGKDSKLYLISSFIAVEVKRHREWHAGSIQTSYGQWELELWLSVQSSVFLPGEVPHACLPSSELHSSFSYLVFIKTFPVK